MMSKLGAFYNKRGVQLGLNVLQLLCERKRDFKATIQAERC